MLTLNYFVLFIPKNLVDSLSCYQTKGLSQFSHQFGSYLRNTLNVVQKNINFPSHQIRSTTNSSTSYGFAGEDASDDTILSLIDEIILDPSNLAVKLNAMCILYHNLFGNLDQKLFAAVIEINTKVCSVLEFSTISQKNWWWMFLIYYHSIQVFYWWKT